jgi:hypothetical protein
MILRRQTNPKLPEVARPPLERHNPASFVDHPQFVTPMQIEPELSKSTSSNLSAQTSNAALFKIPLLHDLQYYRKLKNLDIDIAP